jgi:hypothetical protein
LLKVEAVSTTLPQLQVAEIAAYFG